MEPRAFPFYGKLFLSFHNTVFVSQKKMDTTMFWDFEEDQLVMPVLTDDQPQSSPRRFIPRDKHWSPFTWRNHLHMVYSLDPFRTLKCDARANCKFSQNTATSSYRFDDLNNCLRGGTPTVLYDKDFYISMAHTTLFRHQPEWKRYYTANLLVLRASESGHQVVYLSEPIEVHPMLLNSIPIVRKEFIIDPFLFPVTLLVETNDSIVVGGHINDHSSYLFRLTGLRKFMEKVMARSRQLGTSGPADGFLNNLSREFAGRKSGYRFKTST